MSGDIVEIWEDRETWLRIASLWSVSSRQARHSVFTDRTWGVMPKICGQIHARCQGASGAVALTGSRDGWAILTGFLSNVNWGQVVNNRGGRVFARKEELWAGEVGHRLVLGTTICERFAELGPSGQKGGE
jgi:hypothetical protein